MEINGRCLLFFFYMATLHSTAQAMTWGGAQALKIYALPGWKDGGSGTSYLQELLKGHELNIKRIATPPKMSDLGQDNCIKNLRDALQQEALTQPAGVVAASMSTATVLNCLARFGNDKDFKFLWLESVLLSGNRAIRHTLSGPEGHLGPIMYAPLADLWVPHLARLTAFPGYCPEGIQAIKSLSNIPNNIPVIIAHAESDHKVPYEDALALYYGLKMHGNNDVYLITKKGSKHTNILEKSDGEIVQNILKKHNIIPGNFDGDLSTYQPDHTEFKAVYEDILAQEDMQEDDMDTLYAVTAFAAGYAAVKAAMYVQKKLNGGK